MTLSKTTQKWIGIAQEDLRDAEALLEMNERFLKFVVFAAQQAGEKIIKAYLTHHKVRFPNTHDIEHLIKMIEPIDKPLAADLFEATRLTLYAVMFRYPDAAKEELTLKLGTNAVKIAKKTVELTLTKLN